MNISNSTVYHSLDLLNLFKAAIDSSTPKSSYYGGRKVRLLKVRYDRRIRCVWHQDDQILTLRLPRKSRLSSTSPLMALAACAEDYDDDDETYCYCASNQIVQDTAKQICERLGRNVTGQITGLRLRYCQRLSKGQKQAQTMGELKWELENLEEKRNDLNRRINKLNHDIALGQAWNAKKTHSSVV